MTDLQERIDRVMELDKARTPGEWSHGCKGTAEHIYNGLMQTRTVARLDSYPEHMANARFIAAAPEMVSIIKELQAQLSDYEEVIKDKNRLLNHQKEELNMYYKVVTKNNPHEVWASGFYGDEGKAKAEKMLVEGYWHKFMCAQDKHKELEVMEDKKS